MEHDRQRGRLHGHVKIPLKAASEIQPPTTSPVGGSRLNDSARAFIPDGAQWTAVPSGPATVLVATDETLLAMKLAAERGKDILDLSLLASRLGITDPERIVDIAFDLYGEDSIPLSGERDNYLIVAAEALRLNIGEPSDDPVRPASRRRGE